MPSIDASSLQSALELLGAVMGAHQRPPVHLVVCGGSALIALHLVTRTTQDVDVLAVLEHGSLICAKPLPEWLMTDAEAVRRELGLPPQWLNDGPADHDMFRLGLPVGVVERLIHRSVTPSFNVSFISRLDQIHFKLYAAADQGGRHFTDLRRLQPTSDELRRAAEWTFTQDSSQPFRETVRKLLIALGHEDVHL